MASVGSANFDNRSLELNFESNAVVYDKEIAKKVKAAYLDDVEHGAPSLPWKSTRSAHEWSRSRRISPDSTARSLKI